MSKTVGGVRLSLDTVLVAGQQVDLQGVAVAQKHHLLQDVNNLREENRSRNNNTCGYKQIIYANNIVNTNSATWLHLNYITRQHVEVGDKEHTYLHAAVDTISDEVPKAYGLNQRHTHSS